MVGRHVPYAELGEVSQTSAQILFECFVLERGLTRSLMECVCICACTYVVEANLDR